MFVSTLRLSAAEVFPDELVVGISIGAINAALIVGNPPELRVERLREFWRRISVNVGPPLPAWLDALRPAVNYMAARQLPPSASQDFTGLECRQRRSRRTGPKAP